MLNLISRQFYYQIFIIPITPAIITDNTTLTTRVHDANLTILLFNTNLLHHGTTRRRPITGINIHMTTPKALWTVISIAITLYTLPTMLTSEVFNYPHKVLGHGYIIHLNGKPTLPSLDREGDRRILSPLSRGGWRGLMTKAVITRL